jgi:hypothetical protein
MDVSGADSDHSWCPVTRMYFIISIRMYFVSTKMSWWYYILMEMTPMVILSKSISGTFWIGRQVTAPFLRVRVTKGLFGWLHEAWTACTRCLFRYLNSVWSLVELVQKWLESLAWLSSYVQLDRFLGAWLGVCSRAYGVRVGESSCRLSGNQTTTRIKHASTNQVYIQTQLVAWVEPVEAQSGWGRRARVDSFSHPNTL